MSLRSFFYTRARVNFVIDSPLHRRIVLCQSNMNLLRSHNVHDPPFMFPTSKQASAFYSPSKSTCFTFTHMSRELDALSANGKPSELSDATSRRFSQPRCRFCFAPPLHPRKSRSYETRCLRSHGGANIDLETRRYHLSTAFTLEGTEDGIRE